jgi:retron-type reverse transcriptase
LNRDLDPISSKDSQGYRPDKSALDAVGVTRERCWKYDWVPEFDIKGVFDNISREILLKAVHRAQLNLVRFHNTEGGSTSLNCSACGTHCQ